MRDEFFAIPSAITSTNLLPSPDVKVGIDGLDKRARLVLEGLARCELLWDQLVFTPGPQTPPPGDPVATAGDRFLRVANALDEAIRRLGILGDDIAERQE